MTSLCGLEGGATAAAVGAAVDCHRRVGCLLPAGRTRSLGARRVVAVAEDQELSRHGYRNGVSVLESRREPARDEDMRREWYQLSSYSSLREDDPRLVVALDAPPPPPVLRMGRQIIRNWACSAPGASSWRRSPRFLILTTRYAPRYSHETFWVSDM